MKKILLVALVLLGLQTQAQITLCDSNMTYTIGSQYQLEVAIPVTGNSLPCMTPLYAVTYGDGNMLAEDSCFNGPCTHMIYNYNPNGTYYDTLTTCISYIVTDTMGYIDTLMCCFDQYWDGSSWAKLSMQQANPYFCCDSITYWTDQGQGLFVGLDTSGIIHNPDSMTVSWQVCNSDMCYVGDGINAYFGQIVTTDTIKVGYDVYIYENGVLEICSIEEWLIFDGTNWVLLNMIPTSINELTFNRINDNKIYNLLGKEVTNITIGQMYIRNNKKYIRIK
tara:strand:- start:4 stop:840 length:837 start_codon:yes stop_codon:yes gene_type:complete